MNREPPINKSEAFRSQPRGRDLASAQDVRSFEILIGRGLACCVHPQAAWRATTRKGRAFVICAYAAAGFVTTLTALVYFA
jgi:hypothetical protein